VAARAVQRWSDHPVAIGEADQIADCGHGLYVKGVDSLVSGVDRRT
jgi:hypothetical protein